LKTNHQENHGALKITINLRFRRWTMSP